jgi:Tfp pilus assembly protein PilF
MPKPDQSKKDLIEEYRAAVEANPGSVEAQNNLGWGLYGEGRYEEAVRQFEKALALNGSFFDSQYGMALANKKAGRYDQAVSAFEKARGLVAGIEDKNRSQLMSRILQSHLNELRTPH